MFEREYVSPERVAEQYSVLPPEIITVHDSWTAHARTMQAEAPSLREEQVEAVQHTIADARRLSLGQLHMLPEAFESAREDHKEILKRKGHAASQVTPDNFAHGVFMFDSDQSQYQLGARIPNFEMVYDDICAQAMDYESVIDKEALHTEYNKIIEDATASFKERVGALFSWQSYRLDMLSPRQIQVDLAAEITRKHNAFVERRLNRIRSMAAAIPERTRTQRMFRAIGRIATFGTAYTQDKETQKRLDEIIARGLSTGNGDLNVSPKEYVSVWLAKTLKQAEEDHIVPEYNQAVAQVIDQLQDLKNRFISTPQSEQARLAIALELATSRLNNFSYTSPADFRADLTLLADCGNDTKKLFRRFSLELHPDSSSDPGRTEDYFRALGDWYAQRQRPKNQR